MRKSNERLRRAIEAGDAAASSRAAAASRADRELHAVLIDATGNPKLVEILLSLKAKLRRLEVVHLGGSVVAARSADEHDDLIDALAGGDVEAAVGIVTGNWQQSYERILAYGDATQGSHKVGQSLCESLLKDDIRVAGHAVHVTLREATDTWFNDRAPALGGCDLIVTHGLARRGRGS